MSNYIIFFYFYKFTFLTDIQNFHDISIYIYNLYIFNIFFYIYEKTTFIADSNVIIAVL